MAHGDHFGAILGQNEEVIAKLIPIIVAEGKVMEASASFIFDDGENPSREEQCFGLQYGEENIRYLALLASDSLAKEKRSFLYSAYPVMNLGYVHRLRVTDVNDHENPLEGIIEASIADTASISFFDPFYFLNKHGYEIGQEFDFVISGLAYSLRKAEPKEFEIDEGPLLEMERNRVLDEDPRTDVSKITSVTVSLEGAKLLMPTEFPDDYEFRGTPEVVEKFKLDGQTVYQLTIALIKMDGVDDEFRILLYATEAMLEGYIPKVGEEIEGVLWLQGQLTVLDEES